MGQLEIQVRKSREHGNLVPGKIPNIGGKVAKQKKKYIYVKGTNILFYETTPTLVHVLPNVYIILTMYVQVAELHVYYV